MKKIYIIISVLLAVNAMGQISITHADYQSAFSMGTVYYSYSTPIGGPTLSVFVGEASPTAQAWDFSNYNFEYMAWSQSINPADAPLFNDFPASNIVLYERSWIPDPDTISVWNYKELQADQFLLHGLSDETSVLLTYDPPAIHAVVPLEYGASWVRERDSTFIMEGFWIISEGQVTVDAFGTMMLPGGAYACLRLTQNHVTETHTPVGTTTTMTRSYHFYSKDVHEVNLPTILEDQFGLTTIDIPSVKFSRREGGTGISDPAGSGSIVLFPNSPNPFLTSTMLGYRLMKQTDINLKVYDFTGREVAALVNCSQPAGDYFVQFDAQELPAGVYFFGLTAENRVYTGKMVKAGD